MARIRWLAVASALLVCSTWHTAHGYKMSKHIGPESDKLPGWLGEVSPSKPVWNGEIVNLSWAPRAFLLKGFLSDDECDHLIEMAKPDLAESFVVDKRTGESHKSNVRTSEGTFLDSNDEVVRHIELRVSQVSMLPAEHQEKMQILRYMNGQKYEPHHDYFDDTVNTQLGKGGQRVITILMYLTTPEEGGETVFPHAQKKVSGPGWSDCALRGLAVKARRGDALMFFSLHADGTPDRSSVHGSCPTTKGVKWSATKWIHVYPIGLADEGGDCEDANVKCTQWAEEGECELNPRYMLVNCRKACNICKPQS